MVTKFKLTKISQTIFVIVIATTFLVGLTRFNPGDHAVSAENPLASDFLRYLQDAGHAVALNPDEVVVLAEELMKKRISERILYLSPEAAFNTKKEVLGSIYESGILIVAIDTPISILYEAVDTVPIGENAPIGTTQKDLEDLIASNYRLIVVSMIYSYSFMHHVNGYSHSTDFYAYPENVELVAQTLVDSAENEFNSVDTDSLTNKEPAPESLENTCGVYASITWTDGNNPGTAPIGKAKCGFPFNPYHIRAFGTMYVDCDYWHKVGNLDVWNKTPYSVSQVSGGMTGFPFNPPPGGSNHCGPGGNTHKSPVSGTATVTAEARDYIPSTLQSQTITSSKTVYYPQ